MPISNTTTSLAPNETLMSGGYDWSWAFVYYKEIPGFPRYRVASAGHVWHSWGPDNKSHKFGRPISWIRMKGSLINQRENNKRIRVCLNNGIEIKPVFVHRLVAETFIGPCPPGMQCCHNDGNRFNNDVMNLRWGTAKENAADRRLHGRDTIGVRHGNAKFSDSDIRKIREFRSQGMTLTQIAEIFCVHYSTISDVVHGKGWSHVLNADGTVAIPEPVRPRRKRSGKLQSA